jgi:hypothetical protein
MHAKPAMRVSLVIAKKCVQLVDGNDHGTLAGLKFKGFLQPGRKTAPNEKMRV